MIGNAITGKLIGWTVAGSLAFSIVASTGAYFKGRHDGKLAERAAWEEGVEDAEDRAEQSETEFNQGADKVPAVIERETKTIYRVDEAAIKQVARLEGQIEDLKWELENVQTNNVCPGPIPTDWRLQHDRLDRILQGVSETGRTGSYQGQTGTLGSRTPDGRSARD